ncbi:Xylose isomerase-like TIM barrel [Pseudovibrio axinellae]|uniref:Xylose isomerase-like TIM barrel n=1 Tax=Pseudovibrio axinellae TaxID=989403 RepID=A0A165T0Z2_9HYPH|nr:sugar phosphate isomerase/epimerase [Pseudovibrio axinellae]KZL05146.1 Xylose isomerase-like TIM barrel [Pseudovibrio axinellae]SER49987.1 Sugar phosphate isomerase/epimerase [Pseudovibrio axinellae]
MDFCLQLHSARKVQTWNNVFQQAVRLGYTQVEGFQELYTTLEAAHNLRSLLDQYDLDMPIGHFDLSELEENLDESLQIAGLLGIHTIFSSGPMHSQPPNSPKDWSLLAQHLECIANILRQKGFHFGWHNQTYEFMPLADGRIPMEIILSEAPTLEWEVDLTSLAKTGADPLEWLEAQGPRITAVHINNSGSDELQDCAGTNIEIPPWRSTLEEKSEAVIYVIKQDDPNNIPHLTDPSLIAM